MFTTMLISCWKRWKSPISDWRENNCKHRACPPLERSAGWVPNVFGITNSPLNQMFGGQWCVFFLPRLISTMFLVVSVFFFGNVWPANYLIKVSIRCKWPLASPQANTLYLFQVLVQKNLLNWWKVLIHQRSSFSVHCSGCRLLEEPSARSADIHWASSTNQCHYSTWHSSDSTQWRILSIVARRLASRDSRHVRRTERKRTGQWQDDLVVLIIRCVVRLGDSWSRTSDYSALSRTEPSACPIETMGTTVTRTWNESRRMRTETTDEQYQSGTCSSSNTESA